ncbi:uncharacterized protein JN550_003773 [Neoarthrinium moseri]|uniref:uncharacterized protein n=1 Tax=Neoarthrinium moseri TaxID=1658444 RepID=UPI001FDBCCFB|nr:uncharacterized protein JN550_003773 [Neoarthrinium moseri]KAI1872899.1 hypothetical protein JN550_003773 [Neoarthrinium moseri]
MRFKSASEAYLEIRQRELNEKTSAALVEYLRTFHRILLHDLNESGFWRAEFEEFADSKRFTFTVDRQTALISVEDKSDNPVVMISRLFLDNRGEHINDEIVEVADGKFRACLALYSQLLIHDLWILQHYYDEDGGDRTTVNPITGFMILPSFEDESD